VAPSPGAVPALPEQLTGELQQREARDLGFHGGGHLGRELRVVKGEPHRLDRADDGLEQRGGARRCQDRDPAERSGSGGLGDATEELLAQGEDDSHRDLRVIRRAGDRAQKPPPHLPVPNQEQLLELVDEEQRAALALLGQLLQLDSEELGLIVERPGQRVGLGGVNFALSPERAFSARGGPGGDHAVGQGVERPRSRP
jgi:hypothetical protein